MIHSLKLPYGSVTVWNIPAACRLRIFSCMLLGSICFSFHLVRCIKRGFYVQARTTKQNLQVFQSLFLLYSGNIQFCGCGFPCFDAIPVRYWKVNLYVVSLI